MAKRGSSDSFSGQRADYLVDRVEQVVSPDGLEDAAAARGVDGRPVDFGRGEVDPRRAR